MVVGSRRQVWNGTADRTSGGLKKKDLRLMNGRLKSIKASRSAKRSKNLENAGWTAKKGSFGAVRIEDLQGVKVKKKKKTPKRSGSKKKNKRN